MKQIKDYFPYLERLWYLFIKTERGLFYGVSDALASF